MAFTVLDRIKETSATTGTGDISLSGTKVDGFDQWSEIGDGNTTFYAIENNGQDEWETGIGTYTLATNSLSRDTVSASSNGDALVAFSGGTKNVFVSQLAANAIFLDDNAAVDAGSVSNGQLFIGNATNSVFDKTTLTAGEGIDITNAAGAITILGEDASATNKGIVELATDAETNTGTSTTLAITPANITAWTGSTAITKLGTIGGDLTVNGELLVSRSVRPGSTGQNLDLKTGVGFPTRFTITTTGDVGINVALPVSLFETRGSVGVAGIVTISTAETTIVDGNILGQINFQAPEEVTGGDAILVAASIWAESSVTFSSSLNTTDLVFATAISETATEKMRLTSAGELGVGTPTPVSTLEVVSEGVTTPFTITRYHTDPFAAFICRAARGTQASPSAVQNDDIIGQWSTEGYGATGFGSLSVGRIQFTAQENFTDSAKGTSFSIDTTAIGSSSGVTRFTIAADGTIGMGTSAPVSILEVVSESNSLPLTITRYKSDPFPAYVCRAARGTQASPSAVQSGNTIGIWAAEGYGATGFSGTAMGRIQFTAQENFTDSAKGTSFSIDTTAIGSSSGVTRFTIDTSGNVGVNNTDPGSLLDVRGAVGTAGVLTLSTAETTIVDNDVLGQIDFQAPKDAAGTDAILVAASIWAESTVTFSLSLNTTDLVFATAVSETATEKMRLTSAGDLGVGISAPAGHVHIFQSAVRAPNSAGDDLVLETAGNVGMSFLSGTGSNGFFFFGDADDDDVGILDYDHANDSFGLTVNAARRFTIVSSGNVGINTILPQTLLEVSATDGTAALTIRRADLSIVATNVIGDIDFAGNDVDGAETIADGIGARIRAIASNSWGSAVDDHPCELRFFTQSNTVTDGLAAPRMTIHDDGSVGIGTTAFPTGGGTPVLALGVASGNPTSIGANTAGIFVKDVSSSGELHAFDEAGNVALLSPHDPETGEWIFYSKNTKTGRVVRVRMEEMMRRLAKIVGADLFEEFYEDV